MLNALRRGSKSLRGEGALYTTQENILILHTTTPCDAT
jgi:hypothetical protein